MFDMVRFLFGRVFAFLATHKTKKNPLGITKGKTMEVFFILLKGLNISKLAFVHFRTGILCIVDFSFAIATWLLQSRTFSFFPNGHYILQ